MASISQINTYKISSDEIKLNQKEWETDLCRPCSL